MICYLNVISACVLFAGITEAGNVPSVLVEGGTERRNTVKNLVASSHQIWCASVVPTGTPSEVCQSHLSF